MGTTISGPQIYTPDWSNTSGGAGQGWGQGITALGQALFPNPAALAEARLRQAQTGLVGAQTQETQQNIGVGQTAIGARSKLATMFATPGAFADPSNRSQASSLITLLPPQEQDQARHNFAIQMQQSGLPASEIDKWTSGAGITTYGQTPTGAVTLGNIAAGPGYAQAAATVTSAKIGAGERKYEHDNTQIAVLDPTTPSGTGYVPRKDVLAGHFSPVLGTDEQRSASSVQAATPPASHGVVPPASTTSTSSNAASADGDGSPQITPQQTATTVLRTLSGQPPGSAEQSTLMQGTLEALTKKDYGTSMWSGDTAHGTNAYTLAPDLTDVIMRRANELMRMRLGPGGTALDPGAAVTQAYVDFMTANKDNIERSRNIASGQGPQVILKPNATLNPLPEIAPNVPTPPSGRQNIPAVVTQPQQTQQTQQTQPPQRTQQTTQRNVAVAGRTVDTRSGRPMIYVGGDPQTPTSWRPATSAEVATAQAAGDLYK